MVAIPKFILNRLYVSGSLLLLPEGIQFQAKNPIAPGWLTQVHQLMLNEVPVNLEQLLLRKGEHELPAPVISEHNPMEVLLHETVHFLVQDFTLEPGPCVIGMEVSGRGLGRLKFTIQDHLRLAGI